MLPHVVHQVALRHKLLLADVAGVRFLTVVFHPERSHVKSFPIKEIPSRYSISNLHVHAQKMSKHVVVIVKSFVKVIFPEEIRETERLQINSQ